jgi:DNA-binding CsgD family transcriptional regulator
MTTLLLDEREQAAARALIAMEPVPGEALPGESALSDVARLIACDALGLAVLDASGSAVDTSMTSPERAGDDEHPVSVGPLLGIHRLDRTDERPGASSGRGVAVLSLGVRNGPDHVVKLWLVRRRSSFAPRDRALLVLVAPALERLMRERPTSTLPPSLTLQERRVLRQVAAGLSNAEIAERLGIAPCTVRKHLENAYRKLGVTNRMAAVVALEGPRPAAAEPQADRAGAFA